jgi:hypothetical protein
MNTGESKAQRIGEPLVFHMPNRLSMSRKLLYRFSIILELRSMAKKTNPAAVALGRLGGKKSAKGRMEKISPEQRKEIARNAAKVRWAKQGKKAR